MRPNIKTTRDPINHDALPPAGGLGFDYRTRLKPGARVRGHMIYLVVVVTPLALLVTILARLLSPYLSSAFAFSVLTLLSLVWAIYGFVMSNRRVATTRPASVLLFRMLAGPAVWMLCYLATWTAAPPLAYAIPFLLGVVGVAWLADQLANHYIHWLLAEPDLDLAKRDELLSLWKNRWAEGPMVVFQQAADSGDGAAPSSEQIIRRYHAQYRSLAIAYAVGLLILCLLTWTTTYGRMLSGTAALLAAGIVLARRLTPGASTTRSFQAIVANWFTYNAHGTEAPGVFQSPAGSWRARTARTMLGLSLLVFAAAPMTFYFPVGVLISGPGPWQTALERIDSWFDYAHGKKEAPRAPVITADRMLTLLTPTQRAYHDRLGSTSAREAYLQEQADAFRRRALGEGDRLEPYILSRLSNSPEAWFAAALVGSTRGESLYIWSLVVSLLLSIAIPPVLLWFLLSVLAGPPIAAVQAVVDADIARAPRITEWERMVRRLHRVSRQQPANDPCSLRNHLWLGTSALNDYPVFLNRSILHDHAHILGDTGSGKTSVGLSPLVAQLIRLTASRDGQPGDRHSIVIIDLKGEPAFFHGVRAEARASGIPFKWFTNESKRSSYVFNPFMQRCVRDLTPNQQTEILLQSLGLEHGEGYGASYFSRVNRDVLSRVLKDYSAAKKPIRSFRALREVFENKTYFKVRDKTRDAASELLSVVENLADFDALNVISQDEAHGLVSSQAVADAIDMSDVIERPQVVYFYLPAALETASVREIGKLALFSLLSSAVLHEARTGRPGRVYLVIDEFQQLVSKSVDLLLRQARSKGIAMILANQSLSDLRTRDSDLIPVVLNNTRFRQYFSCGDQQQQDMLINASGEAAYDTNLIFEEDDPLLDDTADWRTDAWGYLEAPEQLNIGPRFNRNDIIEISDNEERCIIHVRRGTGLTQFGGYPLLMRGMHHVTLKRNDRRAERSWPRTNPSTVTAPIYPADMPPVIKDKVVIPDPADDDDDKPTPDADAVNLYMRDLDSEPPRRNVLPDDEG